MNWNDMDEEEKRIEIEKMIKDLNILLNEAEK